MTTGLSAPWGSASRTYRVVLSYQPTVTNRVRGPARSPAEVGPVDPRLSLDEEGHHVRQPHRLHDHTRRVVVAPASSSTLLA